MVRTMFKKRLDVDRCRHSSNYFKRESIWKKEFFFSKKAQITIFMILGILVLLAAILVVLMQQEILVFKPGELIPTQKGKVETFLTSCIKETGEDALFLIGLHGGYLNVSEDILKDASQHLKLSPFSVVPFWAKGQTTRIPPLSDIKIRIDSHIEAKLKNCLLGDENFNKSYNIIEKSAIKANTEIVDKKVIFNVRWDLDIRDKAGEVISEVIDHVAESNIKLKRIHETATSIINTEMNQLKFEDMTIDLLSLGHPKVPITGVELSCSRKKWSVAETKKTFQDMLRVNVGQLKVKGTDYVEFTKSQPYLQNHYVWDTGVKYSDIDVAFSYSNNFPFYFEVTPRDGDYMKSGMTAGTEMISYVCLQLWKFTYDISYPVLVQIKDDKEKYVFNVAFTVHVNRNRADRTSQGILTPSGVTISYPEAEEYCGQRKIPITVNTYELIENNETGVYWKEPLTGVNLTYTCLNYKCDIGQTTYNFAQAGNVAAIKTNFPYCSGGILRGTKENYQEVWKRVVANKEQKVDLELIQLLKFPATKIKVVKNGFSTLEGLGAKKLNAAQSLGKKETVSLKITRSKEEGRTHQETLVLSSGLDSGVLNQSALNFLAGTDYEYQLEIYLMDEKTITGGYSGNWTVDWDKLNSAQEITFHVMTKDQFKNDAELYGFIGDLKKYTLVNSAVLEPEIK